MNLKDNLIQREGIHIHQLSLEIIKENVPLLILFLYIFNGNTELLFQQHSEEIKIQVYLLMFNLAVRASWHFFYLRQMESIFFVKGTFYKVSEFIDKMLKRGHYLTEKPFSRLKIFPYL